MAPTCGHLVWALAALALLAGALALMGLGVVRARRPLGVLSRALTLGALGVDLGLIVYRDLLWKPPRTCPIENNFDSTLLFVVMLGGLLFYLLVVAASRGPGRWRHRGGIDLVLLPLMLLVQSAAAGIGVLGLFDRFGSFAGDVWRAMHLASLIVGALFLAAAAAAGAMYLLADRGLRRKTTAPLLGGLPSLERLDRLIQHAVLVGFPLLTFGMITGALLTVQAGRRVPPHGWLAVPVWLAFAIVLHTQFAPRFRGRRVAWFAIAGFVLLLGVYLVVQVTPGKS